MIAPYDILGMASRAEHPQHPDRDVDPQNRNVVAVGSQIAVTPPQPEDVDEKDIPTSWEGFFHTGFLHGKEFMLDLRPARHGPVGGREWGMDRVLKLANMLRAADSSRSWHTDAHSPVAAGEVPLHLFRQLPLHPPAMEDAGDNLQVGLISDPVPVSTERRAG